VLVSTAGAVGIVSVADGSVHEIPVDAGRHVSSVSWSASGDFLFVAGVELADSSAFLARLDLDGTLTVLHTGTEHKYFSPQASPDGRRVAFAVQDSDSDVWLMDFQTT